jgi:hypothetical protein
MHDTVLVPEGRIDVDLLRLIGRAIDTQQSWTSDSECRFEAHVGIVPTHDGSVVVTYQTLSTLHPAVACIVDGDAAGIGYAAQLAALKSPPQVVVRWPDGWTIEDVVGWLVRPEPQTVLGAINVSIQPALANVEDLVLRLKVKGGAGFKGDLVGYETVAAALAISSPCIARARELLNALADVLLGKPSALFAVPVDAPTERVLIS